MKKNLWLIALAFLLASCSNLLNQNSSSSSSESKSNDGNTYLVVDKAAFQRAASSAREAATNLSPTQEDLKVENLKNIKITVKLASGESKTLLEVDAYENLADYKIPVEEGTWDYTLSAMLKDVPYSGTTRKEIKKGLVNTISFKLSSDIHYGKLSLIVSWLNAEENSNANKIIATLKDAEQTKTIATKIIEDEDIIQKSAAITFDKDSNGSELPGGVYYLSLVFYNEYTQKPLNTTEYYVNIAEGITTKATLKVNLKETFKVIYHDNDGQLKDGEVKTLKFSMLSDEITLPQMTRAGYFFDGWYKTADFSGDPITKITPSTAATADFNVYAKWNAPVLYVSDYYMYRSSNISATSPDKIAQDEFVAEGNVLGNDSNDGFSPDTPLKTINGACAKIVELGTPDMNWVIKVAGRISGIPNDATDNIYKDIGRSEIPEEVDATNAKSLTIEGSRGLDGNKAPKDIIDRGCSTNNTSSSVKGLCLVINTTVPVTFKNIKITGGDNDSNTASSSDAYSQKGGGIYIREGATVSLADGTVIYKNWGYYGGGVYNEGTLYVYGTAIIGNKTQTETAYQNKANHAELGGGAIYNKGNVYLGYSKDPDASTYSEASWTGCINYNCSWQGAGIHNTASGKIYMRDGTIGHNQNVNGGSAEGGGVLNKGYFEMSGGSIEYNIEGGNTGGAGVLNMNTGTFKFSDGTIKGNMAVSGSSNNGKKAGGGVYNNGIMYIYGNAVIGDDEATEIATAANHSNTAVGEGGGIYVAENGKLYMGFSDYTSETVNTPVKWNKGIYYNYSESGGGGLGFATGSSVVINMNSGTIANNGAAKKGGAACISSNAFTISGTATIPATKIPKPEDPAEDDGTRQSIFINGGSLNIASSLSHIKNGELYLIPKDNETSTSTATGYSTYKPLIALTSAATAAGLTIADVKDKFVIEPFTNPKTGIITNWTIDNSGTVAQNLSTFYVSSVSKGGSDSNTGLSSALPLLSIAAAVEKMNDSTKDYTIILNTVDGELTEPQVIADPVGGKIKAHSIKIEGSKASGLSDTNSVAAGIPKDIINANLGATQEGSALTINTTVPVTLRGIMVKGGHGTVISSNGGSLVAGGGLFIGEGATVSLEQYTRITDNTNYYNNTNIPGAGAGVYVSKDAKLFIDYKVRIHDNTGTQYGAGVYVANGGYLRTQAGSGSYIQNNTFISGATSTCGGGVYLDDEATFEMFGCYIQDNALAATDVTGSGVYVSGNANFKISGRAEVSIPNDVYLVNNVPIEVIDSISAPITARLTPASYPIIGKDDVNLIIRSLASERYLISWETVSNKFEVTPQDLGGGVKQYWDIDASTAADATGKLIQKIGTNVINVTIPTGLSDDIEVTVTSGGTSVTNNTHLTGGATLNFTANYKANDSTPNYYEWKLDGVRQGGLTSSTYTLDTSTLAVGTYDIYLEVTDQIQRHYSYTAQVKVTN